MNDILTSTFTKKLSDSSFNSKNLFWSDHYFHKTLKDALKQDTVLLS